MIAQLKSLGKAEAVFRDMRRDAVDQRQECSQPGEPLLAEAFDVCPAIRARNGAAERHHD